MRRLLLFLAPARLSPLAFALIAGAAAAALVGLSGLPGAIDSLHFVLIVIAVSTLLVARHVSKGSQTWPELRSLICHMLHPNEPPARPAFTRNGTLKPNFHRAGDSPGRPAAR